jgi:hypothetical protein
MKISLSIMIGAALIGCMGGRDVVAESALRQQPQSDGDAATPASNGCSDDAYWIAIMTKQHHIFRTRLDSGEVEDLGVPDCLEQSGYVIAVDRSGAIWVQPGDDGRVHVIDPGTLACESLDLKLQPYAMAFVHDPATDSERLYVAELRTLSVIDPRTLKKTVIGELETPQLNPSMFTDSTRGLSGTSNGQLFAISDGDAVATAAVGRVDLGSARITTLWPSIPRYSADLLIGGTVWGDDFALVFAGPDGGTTITRFHTATGRTSTSLAPAVDDSQPIAVGASSCASLR